jgi:hypothetical protein
MTQGWADLFRIIFRIFDDKQLETIHTETERQEWLGTTCSHALRSVIEVTHQAWALANAFKHFTTSPLNMHNLYIYICACVFF